MNRTTMLRWTTRTALVAVLALGAAGVPAEFQKSFDFSSDELTVSNLIGEIRVESGRGGKFVVEVQIRGEDSDRQRPTFDVTDDELAVVFPRASTYIYPRMGRGSRTTFSNRGGGDGLMKVLGEMIGRNRISVKGSGDGVEVWADITIRVPSGGTLVLENGVGDIVARDIDGELMLGTRSGGVEVSGVRGELMVDTGSGSVAVEDVDGDVNIDTGSGTVSVRGVRAGEFLVDTGSGRVSVEDVEADSFNVDTGSGGVKAAEIRADSAVIDTGSGSVFLELVDMGSGEFVIDTGSGGVELILPPGASARVVADTGSGGVRLDIPGGVDMQVKERDEARFTIGGGAARIEIDTGSGGITIRQR